MILSTALIVGLVVSTILPLISSLISRVKTPPEITGLITLFLAALTGFFVEWQRDGDGFDWRKAATAAFLSYLVAVGARLQLWAGTKTDAKALAVGSK